MYNVEVGGSSSPTGSQEPGRSEEDRIVFWSSCWGHGEVGVGHSVLAAAWSITMQVSSVDSLMSLPPSINKFA